MKKKITLMFLLSMLMAATAQAKTVRQITYAPYSGSFKQFLINSLGGWRYRVDSLVISQTNALPDDWAEELRDLCENGRLTGIDLTGCKFLKEIPDMAFMSTMINGAPRKATAEDGGDGGHDYWRTNLRYITLPKSIEKIGEYAFCNTNLERMDIPYWVEKIGNGAFSGCDSLKNVVLYGNKRKAEEMGWQFSELPAGAVLHVAPGCAQYYDGREAWAAFGEVREDDTAFKTMTLALDGSVALKDMMGDDYMCVDSMKISGVLMPVDRQSLYDNIILGRLYSVDLSDIGSGSCELLCMEGCKMDYFILPKTVNKIPTSFLKRSAVRHLTMPESYERIGTSAFEDFRGDFPNETFTVPEGCRRIDAEAFEDCEGIKTMILPSTLDELEPWALGINFYNKKNPKDMDLYVNRMYPPTFVSSYAGWYDDYYMKYGPFGEALDDWYPTAPWRLYVPVGAKKNYENDEHWSHFKEIIETPLLTGWSTGINETQATQTNGAADGIYTLDGRTVSKGTTTDNLPRGLYIVRENGQARKVIMGR